MNVQKYKIICKPTDRFGFGTDRICASLRLADDSENRYLYAIWLFERPDRIYLLFFDELEADSYLSNEDFAETCSRWQKMKQDYSTNEEREFFDGAILLSNEDKSDYKEEIRALAQAIYNIAVKEKLYYEFEEYWQWVEDWVADTDCEEPIEHNTEAWTDYDEYVEYVHADGEKLELYEMEALIQGKKVYLGYIKYQEFPNAKLCYVSSSKVLAGIIKKYGEDGSVVDRDTVTEKILSSVTEVKRERDIRSSEYCYYYEELLKNE